MAHQIKAGHAYGIGFVLHYSILSEDYKQDHYCVNFCGKDKRSKSGENLSFFNFPSNDLLRSNGLPLQGKMKDRISRVAS